MISKRNRMLLDKIKLAKNYYENDYKGFGKMFLDQAIEIILDYEKRNNSSDRKSSSFENGRKRKLSHLRKII